MESVRSFIAVEPDDGTMRWLELCLETLRSRFPRVRWVRRDHLHLTLRFLGDLSAAQAEEVSGFCARVAATTGPFRLEFSGPGHFGPARSPRVFWMGYRADEELDRLRQAQSTLSEDLGSLGIPDEERPWTPHLTLGRNPRRTPCAGWEDLLPPLPGKGAPSMTVEELRLYASQLTPEGPVHRVLWQGGFGGAPVPSAEARP